MKKLLSILALMPLAAHAGSAELCVDMGTSATQCDCATTSLNSNITLEDRNLYDTLSDTFLSLKGEEMPLADAWESAFESTATQNNMTGEDLLLRMESVGQKHVNAIDTCS
ncbi:hypothetical protein [Maritimibacter sp. UBA3975]|uniref:hypothetical protein n=1 Tax=Maritimibacter sp. UBA3975 TaxID=1946833 RepID=UPI000C0A879B|nr:hypothetical protein [Maritimibacter sp. UBA3975]MAM60686.1 hypothetical protein [Maritimibacter sp.]